jgi:hypothetical protein
MVRLPAPRSGRFRSVKTRFRRTHVVSALLAALAASLLAAPPALADNGTGLAGPITDKTVTFFCFGVIIFFAALVIVLSLIQGRLERKKEMRQYDIDRFGGQR